LRVSYKQNIRQISKARDQTPKRIVEIQTGPKVSLNSQTNSPSTTQKKKTSQKMQQQEGQKQRK
jgi:hypothetical protein